MTDESDETALAFDHPEARAKALAGTNPPDRISLRDHIVAAEIGAFQPERGLTQRLRFNMVVELRPQNGADSDDVDQILSYDRLTDAIATELAAERLNLLETLAERICARILREPQPLRVFLRIEKLDRGPGALGVEIVRSRAANPQGPARNAPRPVIAFVSADVTELSAWLDRLADPSAPLIVVPALPDGSGPVATSHHAALRIGLLQIEQAAWALSGDDLRLSVVGTRTEIDWAMKHGKRILWAPSKLILDTAGAPDRVGNGLPLAVWLAETLNAAKLVVHAPVALPAKCRVPVERG